MTQGGSHFSPKAFSKEAEEKRAATREKNQSLIGENHPRAKLTNEEVVKIRQRYKDGEPIKSIHQDYVEIYSLETFQEIVLGYHYSHAGNVPSALDKRMTNSKFTTDDIINIRKAYYLESQTQTSLAQQYSVSQSVIKDIVNRNSYKEVKDNIPNKRKRQSYRLTADQVRDIRQRYAEGISIQELASEYCIDSTAIRNCINRKTYKNIE